MAGRLAILAGNGALPRVLADAFPDAAYVTFTPDAACPAGHIQIAARFEQLGKLFSDLRNAGVDRVVMAGAMSRPQLDPTAFDPETQGLLPRIMNAMSQGDDGLLREIIAIFEDQGFSVLGAHELLPQLTARPGLLCGPEPDQSAKSDTTKARTILTTLAPLDLGQGVVVAGGLCLGVETLQGTDAMLAFVAETPEKLRRAKGVLVKAPKPGQELRVDMPAIGPATASGAIRAGLAGIVIDAGAVLILERERTIDALEKAGLFLLAQ